jgi:ATP-dependent DNA helicase RecG
MSYLTTRKDTVSEQAGSGIPKIRQAWNTEHRVRPQVQEKLDGEQTEWILPTTSMLSPDILNDLTECFGDKFQALTPDERLALAIAATEGRVSNNRLQELTSVHRHDLTDMLRRLIAHAFLAPHGVGRGTYYVVDGHTISGLRPLPWFDNLDNTTTDSEHLDGRSEHLDGRSEHLMSNRETIAEDRPDLSADDRDIIQRVFNSGKIKSEIVKQAIHIICRDNFMTLSEIANQLNRTSDTLRTHYVAQLVRSGALELRFPDKLNHPEQAYRNMPK